MRVDIIVGAEIRTFEGATEGDRVKVIVWAGAPHGDVRTVCDGFLTARGELATPPGVEWDERNPTAAGR